MEFGGVAVIKSAIIGRAVDVKCLIEGRLMGKRTNS